MKSPAILSIPVSALSSMLYIAGVSLCILATKFWLIHTYGSSTPHWDQWDAEAAYLMAPAAEGSLGFSDLVRPHNEHRIFLTRVFSLTLARLNGAWDPRIAMVAQAFIHVMAISLLLGIAMKILTDGVRWPVVLFAGVIFSLPFGWDNTLWGFQSHFYFVLLWGASGILLIWKSQPLRPLWWLGIVFLVLGVLSMAGGVFAVAACLLLSAIHTLRAGGDRRSHLIATVLLAALTLAGLLSTVHVPHHDIYKAQSLAEFLTALVRITAWPDSRPWVSVLLVLPAPLLFFHAMRRKADLREHSVLLLTLLAWAFLHVAAFAHARASQPVVSRYTDNFDILIFLNFTALLFLLGNVSTTMMRSGLVLLTTAWVFVLASATLHQLMPDGSLSQRLQAKQIQSRHADFNIKAFLATGDREHLHNKPDVFISYFDAHRLEDLLSREDIRRILPTSLRPPLDVSIILNEGFKPGGSLTENPPRPFDPVWGSHVGDGERAHGQLTLGFDAAKPGALYHLPVAGHPLSEGISVRLVDANGTQVPLQIASEPGAAWHNALFRAPPGTFTLHVRDWNDSSWVAVSAPRLVTQGQRISGFIARHYLLYASLAPALILAACLTSRAARGR